MPTEFETSISVNGLVVVESLASDERQTGTYLVNDVQAAFLKERFGLQHEPIASWEEFRKLFARLSSLARAGFRPVLHVEAHGLDDGSGLLLQPSGDRVSWIAFASACRELNEATKNNLVVVLATCRGYEALTAVDILQTTPFCLLAGPDRDVMNADLIGATSEFYLEILRSGSLSSAVEHLPKEFRLFNCQALLVRAYVLYLEDHRGKAGDERLERLLTKARRVWPQEPLPALRKRLRERLKDNQRHFTRNSERFLMSAEPENKGRFTVAWPDVEAVLKAKT